MSPALNVLLLQDAGDDLLGRRVGDVFPGARILAVEVAVARQQLGRRHLPRALVLLALCPPRLADPKLLELDGERLRVVLPAFGQRVLAL
jgi:hypothetical protein